MAALRGIWRRQEASFSRPSWAEDGEDIADELKAVQAALPSRQFASVKAIQAAQGLTYSDEELSKAAELLQARMARA